MTLLKALAVLVGLVAALAVAGTLQPETPVLGPAMSALRDGNPGRALGVVAPSLAPKNAYWSFIDVRGDLKIVASLDQVPAELRERAKRIEVESKPLPTAAGGVDARAAIRSLNTPKPADKDQPRAAAKR